MDIQGARVVKPYVEKAGVTFPVAVDTADVLGQAFALKAIPVSIFVDEVGIVRLRGGGPNKELLAQIADLLNEPLTSVRGRAPQSPAAAASIELEQKVAAFPEDWQSRLALARAYANAGRHADAVVQLKAAAKLKPGESSVPFVWGLVLLEEKKKSGALEKLRQARDLEPDNWRIRKQIWAIENPDRFYTGNSPDFDWQKEELAREKSAVEVK